MKNFTQTLFIALICLVSIANITKTVAQNNCQKAVWFQKPSSNSYNSNQAILVEIRIAKPQDIQEIELHVDNRYVRKVRPNNNIMSLGSVNSYLSNPRCGNHVIKLVVKDKCGDQHSVTRSVHVKCETTSPPAPCGSFNGYPGNNRSYKYQETINVGISPKKNSEISYIKVYVDGKFLGNDNSAPFQFKLVNFLHKPAPNPFNPPPSTPKDVKYVNLGSGKHQIKIIVYTKCGGGVKTYQSTIQVSSTNNNPPSNNQTPNRYCMNDSWFKYPANNARVKKGRPVYVRVDTKKYQDISYMELYVDGRKVRRENQYPYEWSKSASSSDVLLRQLRCGRHELKVKVVDKCGKVKYIRRYVYVDCR